MGSLFYTFTEAATRLGCSTRTIHNYVKRGYLRKQNSHGKIVLQKEDVEALAAEEGIGLPAFNRKNFYLLQVRLQRLEADMAIVRRALEIRDEPLRPNVDEAKGLHMAAINALAANHWSDQELETWASVFDRLDEVSFNMMAEALASATPYHVLYQLCMAQMQKVSTDPSFKSSLKLQILHKKLDEGRKALRKSVLMWIEMNNGTSTPAVMLKLEATKDTLFKKLGLVQAKIKAAKA